MKHIKVIGVVLLLTVLISLNSCKKDPYGVLKDNIPPTIELTNVSVISDSTLLPVINDLCLDTLGNLDSTCVDSLINAFFGGPRLIRWFGTDKDGAVVGYWYTFNDTTNSFAEKFRITIIDDDTIREPVPVDENFWNWTEIESLPVKLPSTDTLQAVVFYVISEDDQGALSLERTTERIASTVFLRKNNELPVASIDTVIPLPIGGQVYVLPETTLTWKGVTFRYTAFEIDTMTGDTIEQFIPYEFSFAWDDTSSWSEWSIMDEFMFTKGNTPEFAMDGLHTLYLRTRDDALAVGTPTSMTIETVTPDLTGGIVVVDASLNLSGNPGFPSEEQVDDFYDLILFHAGYAFDTLDRSTESFPIITPLELAPYSTLIYHTADPVNPRVPAVLTEYLDVGGNLLISGRQIFSFLNDAITLEDYFGIDDMKNQASADFIGAIPVPGYPRLDVDSTKMLPADNGKLSKVEAASASDFTNLERLYRFDSATDDPNFECSSGCMVGFRYTLPSTADPVTGDTLSFSRIVGFTFPLYALEVDGNNGVPVAGVVKSILQFFEEP
jgi:hypothetical protein